MKIRDCNLKDDYGVIQLTDNVFDIARKIQKIKYGIVLEDGKPVGIITPNDLIDKVLVNQKNPTSTSAKDIMSSPVTVIKADEDLKVASQIMTKNKYYSLPVVEANGKLMGLLTVHDVLTNMRSSKKSK